MRIAPTGSELLSVARTVLRESLQPYIAAGGKLALREVESAIELAVHKLANELPAAGDDLALLQAARTTLRTTLLEQLPKDRQYDARLVAKVMAIASNELANGDAFERDELERLAALLDEAAQTAGSPRDVQRGLALLGARLSADIRSGRCDPGSARYRPTYAHLCASARQAVSESNPAYLKHRASSAPNRPQSS